MSNKIFDLDEEFIKENIGSLITLEDYIPFEHLIKKYDPENKREKFLKTKKLFTTLKEMDQLVNAKCAHYKHSIHAHNSVLIEWIDCHPEFERVISKKSVIKYQNMKNSNNFIEFVDLLFIKLPSEGVPKKKVLNIAGMSIKDDSAIQLPDFDKMDKIYEKFPNTLLACYLAYKV